MADEEEPTLLAVIPSGVPVSLLSAFKNMKASGWELFFVPGDRPDQAMLLVGKRVDRG